MYRRYSILTAVLFVVLILCQYSSNAQNFGEGVVTTKYNPFKLPTIGVEYGIASLYGDIERDKYIHTVNFNNAYSFFAEQRLFYGFTINGSYQKGAFSQDHNFPYLLQSFKTDYTAYAGALYWHLDNGRIVRRTALLAPFVSLGVQYMSFSPYGDIRDKNGIIYHYWAIDGTIRTQEYDAQNPNTGLKIQKDYKYETNLDSTNKYEHNTLCFPIGLGVKIKINDIIGIRLQTKYAIATTDYLDHNNSIAGNDSYLYTSCALHINIGGKTHPMNTLFKDVDFKAIERSDEDKDGVRDMQDQCMQTPSNAKVDKSGCPLDKDLDGIPDYRDKELASAPFAMVDDQGVTLTEEFINQEVINDSLKQSGMLDLEIQYVHTIDSNHTRDANVVNKNYTTQGNTSYKVNHPYALSNKGNESYIEAGSGKAASTSIKYRIQIGSLGKGDQQSHVQGVYGITDEVFVYESLGRFKYALGDYTNFYEAFKAAENFKAKHKIDCFVIAEEKGVLIPVSKARQLNGE